MLIGASFTAIHNNILDILKNSESPLSTKQISVKTGKSWQSIKKKCDELKKNNLICSIDAKNTILWIFCDERCCNENGCKCGSCTVDK